MPESWVRTCQIPFSARVPQSPSLSPGPSPGSTSSWVHAPPKPATTASPSAFPHSPEPHTRAGGIGHTRSRCRPSPPSPGPRQGQTRTHRSFLRISEQEQGARPFRSCRPGVLSPHSTFPARARPRCLPAAPGTAQAPARDARALHPSPRRDTPTPQHPLILSSSEALRHIRGYHRN